jgi:hypothetical protein
VKYLPRPVRDLQSVDTDMTTELPEGHRLIHPEYSGQEHQNSELYTDDDGIEDTVSLRTSVEPSPVPDPPCNGDDAEYQSSHGESGKGGLKSASLFKKHCDALDRLSIGGLSCAMDDLGLLSNRSDKESQDVVVATFVGLDSDKKNYLNAEQFSTLYDKATRPTLLDDLKQENAELVALLGKAFVLWATFGAGKGRLLGDSNDISSLSTTEQINIASKVQMSSSSFIKLLKDANLVTSTEDITHADLVFAKVKERGSMKITFGQFVDGINLIAMNLDATHGNLMGVAARIAGARPSVNVTPPSPKRLNSGCGHRDFNRASKCSSSSKNEIHIDVVATGSSDELRVVFEQYARFGKAAARKDARDSHSSPCDLRLSSQQFSKLARECGILSRLVTIQQLDVIFAKVKKPRTLGLRFDEFLTALQLVAKREAVLPQYVMKKVGRTMNRAPQINSPRLAGRTDFVRLHDDEQNHCGVYGRRLSGSKGVVSRYSPESTSPR